MLPIPVIVGAVLGGSLLAARTTVNIETEKDRERLDTIYDLDHTVAHQEILLEIKEAEMNRLKTELKELQKDLVRQANARHQESSQC